VLPEEIEEKPFMWTGGTIDTQGMRMIVRLAYMMGRASVTP
jgi:hypothetical protein